jgi:uncharacterized protein YndB with AHSA1/START domain
MANIVATAEIDIAASARKVWQALTDPAIIANYFFGSQVETDWRLGSSIVWRGEWQGKPYEDRGTVLRVEPERLLQVSHFSPLSGLPDTPENHHTVTYTLSQREGKTHLLLQQDNNHDEVEAEHTAENWRTMLVALKRTVEEG